MHVLTFGTDYLNDRDSALWQNYNCFYDDALTELVNHYANQTLFLVLNTSDFMTLELIFLREHLNF